jgi:UDP-4-amino-4,6-dideoxy-N-acetyl-beta-L-altrosamine transaminase
LPKFISYGRQCIDEDDIKAVVEVLRSDFLTQGSKVKEFEQALAECCGAKFGVAFSSGTSALHGAYYSGGIGTDDQVITSSMTFLATANSALFLGGRPVFVDIEQDTGNINVELIEGEITDRTKAIVPVHYAGHPAKLSDVAKISRKHNLIVIEDACHALGAKYMDTTIGDCRFSDMAVFSFHPVKSIATGEGGAVLTNDEKLYEKLLMFRQHGVTKKLRSMQNKPSQAGDWYYEMQQLGYNYRLTDIQCALGVSQLKKLNGFIERRRAIVEIYRQAFTGNKYFDIPVEKKYAKSAWHLYPIRLKDEYKNKKKKIFTQLRENGIGVQVHYIPVYLQPYYQQLGFKKGLCRKAEDFYEREISIPLYSAMSREDIDYVIETILSVFERI